MYRKGYLSKGRFVVLCCILRSTVSHSWDLPQTQHDYLQEYLIHRQRIMELIAAREAPPTIRRCSTCPPDSTKNSMTWRCNDCFGSPVFCSPCIRKSHHHHPFHRLARWNGSAFFRSSAHKAGITLNVGHSGFLCPRYVLAEQQERSHHPQNEPTSMSSSAISAYTKLTRSVRRGWKYWYIPNRWLRSYWAGYQSKDGSRQWERRWRWLEECRNRRRSSAQQDREA